MANAGTLEIIPLEQPLTLFVWSKSRVVPVRLTDFSVTEEAFDPNLNPIRAKVSLGLRVLNVDDLGFAASGRPHVHDLSDQQRAARRRRSASAAIIGARPWRSAMNYPLQALIELGRHPAGHLSDRQPLLRLRRRCTYTAPNGQTITYLARRFVPQPGAPNYATDRAAHGQAGRPARPDRRQISAATR